MVGSPPELRRRRVVGGYVFLFVFVAVIAVASFAIGSGKTHPPSVGGHYQLAASNRCLGSSFQLVRSTRRLPYGQYLQLVPGEETSGSALDGTLKLEHRELSGRITCQGGSEASVRASLRLNQDLRILEGTAGGLGFRAQRQPPLLPKSESRSTEEIFTNLMIAIATVLLAARLFGALVSRIGQPRVMGEVLAGILLGPTLLGSVAPGAETYLFPKDIIPLLGGGADVGLAFYMFLVGLELDPELLRGRVVQAAFISNASIAVPMALGVAVAVPLYHILGPSKPFEAFALFMGVSMSITAFPVLARILVERRMLKHNVGAIALSAAAVDDVTAWSLLALASGVASTGGVGADFGLVILFAVLFSVGMAVIGRRILARVADAYEEAGHVPAGWIMAIFTGVLVSAYVAGTIPIAAIFGAFVMGLIMPRRADLSHDVSRRLEDFVTTVLLPLFFVTTGLRFEIGQLKTLELWLITGLLILVAIFCKWAGAMFGARLTGMSWRHSGALGALMNTRGLTELIVLRIGLDLHVVTPVMFTMLVIMALVTTFMTGPVLRLFDPRGEMSAPPEEELRAAEREAVPARPKRSILVAPQDEKNTDALLGLAEPLAASEPPRELILVRLVTPKRTATGALAREEQDIADAAAELELRGREVASRGVPIRSAAFTSTDPGSDLIRLTSQQEIDLVLVDGRRPLLGEGVPRGDVGLVLREAPCDVAVLVTKEQATPEVGPERPVMIPFGGAEHDWAALELGAWIAAMREAPLVLLGAGADIEAGRPDASRLLANASLVVQQLAGVPAQPLLIERGREGIVEAAKGAGLLVVGLSERWREEGLGPVRSSIARSGVAPTLFVRRGQRPGALAPRDDLTRFTWSTAGTGSRGT